MNYRNNFIGEAQDYVTVQLPNEEKSVNPPVPIQPTCSNISFLSNQLLGAHSSVNIELSAAFIFFILYEDWKNSQNWKNFGWTRQGKKQPIRLEASKFRSKIMIEVLQRSLDPSDNPRYKLNVTGKKLLLVTFPGESKTYRHTDNNEANIRTLWDFHLRGRVLSSNKPPYHGLYIENCGVEVCSRTMCGIEPIKVYGGEDIKVHHQGWDRHHDNNHKYALVTARLDFLIPEFDDDDVLNAFGSPEFNTALSANMLDFVNTKMIDFINAGGAQEDLDDLQIKFNRKMYEEFLKIPESDFSGINRDDFLNEGLQSYLHNLYDQCSDDEYLMMTKMFGEIDI